MDIDIYSVVNLSRFKFSIRSVPFDWRLLHGIDADEVIRLNDTAALEAIIPTLQQGSIDAEPSLSKHNYVQLFRLVQLAVEHLWQMRESHAKLYPAYAKAHAAAESWRTAASEYLHLAGRLLNQLQCESGALLTEEALNEVAVAREALEKADSRYNAALDRLEAEDTAARCHTLRRQRLDISWRLVFGVDVQQLVASGNVNQLEQLLPQVAYANIMSENPAVLAPRHFRQLLHLGQACLDYLWAICLATSQVMEQQVQQLAAASAPIPKLTTSTEEMRAALAAALGSSMQLLRCSPAQTDPSNHNHHCTHSSVHRNMSPANHNRSPVASPTCQHIAVCVSPVGRCRSCGATSPTFVCGGVAAGSVLLASLAPQASNLRKKMDQLEWDLRVERDRTEAMRLTLEEATAMLEQLPVTKQEPQPPQQLQQPQPRPQPAPEPDSPSGGVRVVIDEDSLRADERLAAGQQLNEHIVDIIQHHEFARKLRSDYSSRHTSRSPNVTFTSVPATAFSRHQSSGGGSKYDRQSPRQSPRPSAGAFAAQHQMTAGGRTSSGFAAASGPGSARSSFGADLRAPGADWDPMWTQQIAAAGAAAAFGGQWPWGSSLQPGTPAAAAPGNQPADASSAQQAASEAVSADAAVVVHRVTPTVEEMQAHGQLQQQSVKGKPEASGSFKKARELMRSVSPRRMLENMRPTGRASGAGAAAGKGAGDGTNDHAAGDTSDGGTSSGAVPVQGLPGDGMEPSAGRSSVSSWRSSPEKAAATKLATEFMQALVTRSGSSFSSSVTARAAAEMTAMQQSLVAQGAGRPLTQTQAAQLSPLKTSIVARSSKMDNM